MSQTKSHLPFIYNPSELTKSELIENFVIRTREFAQIFEIIQKDEMQNPPQHIIIQGQRGTGKSTLLLRLSYAIKDDPALNKWLIPVVSDEESWGISTLAEFWQHTAEDIEEIDSDFIGLADEMDKYEEEDNFDEKSFEILQSKLVATNKKLVLFIDNFGDLVKKFNRKEHQRLREMLLTSNNLRIIAASSVVLEFTYKYSEPFYQFFKVFTLKNLNKQEAESLLLKLGESYKVNTIKDLIKNEPQRVEALRRITNGVPRTIVLLYEIFVDNETGNAFRDLEFILDRVTPLYKHRMDDLKAEAQKIINTLALNWDPMPVKDIVEVTKIQSKQVSAQLAYLEKNSIITKQRTRTKNNVYYLSERFFNIWYLMRRGRKKHKNKVRFLVEFLELWCTSNRLLKITADLKNGMHNGTVYEKHALYMTEALACTLKNSSIQHSLIEETRKYLQDQKSDLVSELSPSDIEIHNKIVELLEQDDEIKAIEIVNKMRIKIYDENTIIGMCYANINNFNKAEEFYLKAIGKNDFTAMYNLAVLYQMKYKDINKAEEFYLKANEQGHSYAMNNLGALYQTEYKDINKAEEFYLKAAEQGNSDAMCNLALLYQKEYKDINKAEEFYLKAIKKNNPTAMYNYAFVLFIKREKKKEALRLAKKSFAINKEFNRLYTFLIMLLWNDEIEEAVKAWETELFKEEYISKNIKEISFLFNFFIAKQQYNFIYKLFTENQFELKERYKPIYFALLHFMSSKYDMERDKMGPELKETVDEIVENIKQLAKDYS
jgi:TPR repeat protein